MSSKNIKRFIIDNSSLLSIENKINILNIMSCVIENNRTILTETLKSVDIDLDILEIIDRNILLNIYDIVTTRVNYLSTYK